MQQFLEALQMEWLEDWAAWAVFAGYLAGTLFAAWLARCIMQGVIPRITRRSNTTLDDRLVQATYRPVRFAVLSMGLRMSLEVLGQRIPAIGASAPFDWVEKVSVALVVLALAGLANGALMGSLDWYLHEQAEGNQATWDRELLPVIQRVQSLIIYFIATSIILKHFDQDITALVTTAGVASLAVALAAQETLSNMLAGFTILVDRPFRLGDVIEVTDGKAGEVIEIGLRSTRIRQFDGNALVVPNKDIANSRIVNFALPAATTAIRQTIGVDYGTDIEHAKRVLTGVLESHPEVWKEPAPGVWFTTFGESSLDLFMSCWVASFRDRFRVADELNIQILKAFREQGIRIPFPQRDVHVKLPANATVTMTGAGNRE